MNAWNVWKTYWFSPGSLFTLACCRLLLVGLQLVLTSDGDTYEFLMYRANNAAEMSETLYSPPLIYKLMSFPLGDGYLPSAFFLSVIFALTFIVGITAFIGLFTNVSLMAFVTGHIFMQSFVYSFGEIHHPEAIMMLALGILALGPSGAVLSVDDLWKRLSRARTQRKFFAFNILEESSEFGRWPILLMQWMFALCYFSGFLSKMRYSGFEWANGFTLQYYLARDGFRWGSALSLWFADQHLLAWLGQWTVLVFQGTFLLAVIFPLLRWLYLPLGFSFHVIVYLTMRAPFFTWMGMYGVFIDWQWAFQRLAAFFSHRSEKLEVLFDGNCPLCIRSMTILQYGDWFNRIRYSNVLERWESLQQEKQLDVPMSEFLREMYVVKPDGSLCKGFFAFKELMKSIPLFWMFVPFFYLPFSSSIGPQVYQFVAARRYRFDACQDGVCAATRHKYSEPSG